MNRVDTETIEPRMRDLYRNATPTQKLMIVARLNSTLIDLKDAKLQAQFPAMPEKERRVLLRRWWFGARD